MSRLTARAARLPPRKILVCYGDSITGGAGAKTFAQRWPTVLAGRLGRGFVNAGVGGETSTQILARLVAQVAWAGYTGDDVIYTLGMGRNNATDPTTIKSDIAAAVAALPIGAKYLVLDILNGNYTNEYINQSKWLTITTLNADLASLYGPRYVGTRAYLVDKHDQSAQDLIDFANDIPPTSLREAADNIHPNAAGDVHIADLVEAQIAALGWD